MEGDSGAGQLAPEGIVHVVAAPRRGRRSLGGQSKPQALAPVDIPAAARRQAALRASRASFPA